MHVLERKIQKRRCNNQLQGRLPHHTKLIIQQNLQSRAHKGLDEKLDRPRGLLLEIRYQPSINSNMQQQQSRRQECLRDIRLVLRKSETTRECNGRRIIPKTTLHINAHMPRIRPTGNPHKMSARIRPKARPEASVKRRR